MIKFNFLKQPLKIRKINVENLGKLKVEEFTMLLFNLNHSVKVKKELEVFVNENKKIIISLNRYDLKKWLLENKNIKKVLILNHPNHVKYEYRLLNEKQIDVYLVD